MIVIQNVTFLRFGRRPVLLYSFLFIIIGSFGSALSINEHENFLKGYLFYSFSRFLTGVGTRGINVTGYVLGNCGSLLLSFSWTWYFKINSKALEFVGVSKRAFCGIVFECFFALGQLILAMTAHFVRDAENLAKLMILPTIPLLFYFL